MASRPTKLTEPVADDLVVLFAAGVPIPVAARSVGVSRRTLDRWLRQDELRDRVEQARAAGPVSSEAVTEARLVVLLALSRSPARRLTGTARCIEVAQLAAGRWTRHALHYRR